MTPITIEAIIKVSIRDIKADSFGAWDAPYKAWDGMHPTEYGRFGS